MLKKKLSTADYVSIAANLLPIAGVFLWDWNPLQIFMVYALETVIVGLFTLLKIAVASTAQGPGNWYNAGKVSKQTGLVFMLFFLMHYGIFVLVQTGLFISVSGIGDKFHIGFFDFVIRWPGYIGEDAWYLLISLLVSYGFHFFWNFIKTKQYQTMPLMLLMFQPYGRIFIQQLTVILGGIFLSFGAGKIFLVIFVLVKIAVEIFINYDGIINRVGEELKNNRPDKSENLN